MKIAVTFESIDEMRMFAKKMAGEALEQSMTVVSDKPTQGSEAPVKSTKEDEKAVQSTKPEPVKSAKSNENSAEAAFTLEEVRAKLAELQKAGKRAEVKELLGSFGVTKLSDVPVSKYALLMVKAGEI